MRGERSSSTERAASATTTTQDSTNPRQSGGSTTTISGSGAAAAASTMAGPLARAQKGRRRGTRVGEVGVGAGESSSSGEPHPPPPQPDPMDPRRLSRHPGGTGMEARARSVRGWRSRGERVSTRGSLEISCGFHPQPVHGVAVGNALRWSSDDDKRARGATVGGERGVKVKKMA